MSQGFPTVKREQVIAFLEAATFYPIGGSPAIALRLRGCLKSIKQVIFILGNTPNTPNTPNTQKTIKSSPLPLQGEG